MVGWLGGGVAGWLGAWVVGVAVRRGCAVGLFAVGWLLGWCVGRWVGCSWAWLLRGLLFDCPAGLFEAFVLLLLVGWFACNGGEIRAFRGLTLRA